MTTRQNRTIVLVGFLSPQMMEALPRGTGIAAFQEMRPEETLANLRRAKAQGVTRTGQHLDEGILDIVAQQGDVNLKGESDEYLSDSIQFQAGDTIFVVAPNLAQQGNGLSQIVRASKWYRTGIVGVTTTDSSSRVPSGTSPTRRGGDIPTTGILPTRDGVPQ